MFTCILSVEVFFKKGFLKEDPPKNAWMSASFTGCGGNERHSGGYSRLSCNQVNSGPISLSVDSTNLNAFIRVKLNNSRFSCARIHRHECRAIVNHVEGLFTSPRGKMFKEDELTYSGMLS